MDLGTSLGPIAHKRINRAAEEVAIKRPAIAGVESILKGDYSMFIQSKLESFHGPSRGLRERPV